LRRDQFHAGFERFAIGDHHTLRALPIGTKNTKWRAVLFVVTKYLYSIGKQSSGNGFSLERFQGFSLPIKFELFTFRNR